jgi:signal transduction histidine kinase
MTENDAHPLAVHSEEPIPSNADGAERNPTTPIGSEQATALVATYEAKLDEVADLITRVRHEINNPLTGVLGQAQLLLREDLSERARKRAETIEELAIRIRDIVAQLRQVQKPSR